MQTLSEILDELRAATTAGQYALAINRLREVETDLAELRTRMEAAEEAAIFSGDDPSSSREAVRQCDDDLRTIQVAIAGAEKRMRVAEVSEDAEGLERLGQQVAADADHLADLFATVRQSICTARHAMFEAAALTIKLDAKNETLVEQGRRDLVRGTSRIRREVMGEDLPRAPHTIHRTLRDADKILVAVATGKRPWNPMVLSLSGEAQVMQPTLAPVGAVRPLRRAIA